MDPDACFSELLDALTTAETESAHDRADDLLGWLDRGGFAPGGGKLRLSAIQDFCKWVITTYAEQQ